MAEIVQGILEDTVDDLLDIIEREIFTEQEVKEIIKKRRTHEYKLNRVHPEKKHYLAAIQYELSLEEQRLKRTKNTKPTSADRNFVKRVISLFQRCTRRFSEDVSVWKEFINFTIRSNSERQLTQVISKALQLHPRNEELWLISAYVQAYIKKDIDAARSLHIRSVTLNPKNKNLWKHYLKFESEHGNPETLQISLDHALENLPQEKDFFLQEVKSKLNT